MSDPAHKIEPALPAEVVSALETASLPPEPATLMSLIENFLKAKAEVKASPEPVEEMWPLQALLPVHLNYQKVYQKALRAAKSGQLEATKVGGRWYCTKRAMDCWLAKTGQRKR
jgi:hypothetical protein